MSDNMPGIAYLRFILFYGGDRRSRVTFLEVCSSQIHSKIRLRKQFGAGIVDEAIIEFGSDQRLSAT